MQTGIHDSGLRISQLSGGRCLLLASLLHDEYSLCQTFDEMMYRFFDRKSTSSVQTAVPGSGGCPVEYLIQFSLNIGR